jgi:hypothetical protein
LTAGNQIGSPGRAGFQTGTISSVTIKNLARFAWLSGEFAGLASDESIARRLNLEFRSIRAAGIRRKENRCFFATCAKKSTCGNDRPGTRAMVPLIAAEQSRTATYMHSQSAAAPPGAGWYAPCIRTNQSPAQSGREFMLQRLARSVVESVRVLFSSAPHDSKSDNLQAAGSSACTAADRALEYDAYVRQNVADAG